MSDPLPSRINPYPADPIGSPIGSASFTTGGRRSRQLYPKPPEYVRLRRVFDELHLAWEAQTDAWVRWRTAIERLNDSLFCDGYTLLDKALAAQSLHGLRSGYEDAADLLAYWQAEFDKAGAAWASAYGPRLIASSN